MASDQSLESAQYTCKGLQRLLNKLNMAAIDLDKGGGSIYELSGLLAAVNTCADNLGAQLQTLRNESDDLRVQQQASEPTETSPETNH